MEQDLLLGVHNDVHHGGDLRGHHGVDHGGHLGELMATGERDELRRFWCRVIPVSRYLSSHSCSTHHRLPTVSNWGWGVRKQKYYRTQGDQRCPQPK